MTISHTSLVTRHFRPAVLRGESRRSGIPRRRIAVLLSLITLHFSLLTSLAQTDLRWDVDTSKNISVPLEIRRGESLNLFPRFLSYSVVTQLTNSASVELWYRSADMSNGLYYAITGAVHNATNGQARIPWSNANCGTATNYTYDIVVRTNSVISNLRAFGTIRLLSGVYSQATAVTNPPTAWGLLDWSSISNINLSSAPFPLDSEMASSTSRLASLETGVLGLTNRATSLESGVLGLTNRATSLESGVLGLTNAVIAGDLAGTNHLISATNALDVALRALINAVSQSGSNHVYSATNLLDVALRAVVAASTQTIAGATVTGTVPAATWSAVAATSTNATSAGQATSLANGTAHLAWDAATYTWRATEDTTDGQVHLDITDTLPGIGILSDGLVGWWIRKTAADAIALTNTAGTYQYLLGAGGNVVTNNHPGATFSGTTTASNVVALGTLSVGTTNSSVPATIYGGVSSGVNETLRLSGGHAGNYGGPMLTFGHRYGADVFPTWRLGGVGAIYDPDLSYGGDLVFLVNGSSTLTTLQERMRLDLRGRLGINTTSPTYTLDVNGNTYIRTNLVVSGVQTNLGTVNLAGPVQYGGTNAALWYITTTNAWLDVGTNRIYLTP